MLRGVSIRALSELDGSWIDRRLIIGPDSTGSLPAMNSIEAGITRQTNQGDGALSFFAERSGRNIFSRIAGQARGELLAQLSIATIRAVAQGVIGVAAIQAILVGLALMLAGIKIAGVLAIITLVLGIAQVPAILVTLPVIVYIWVSGDYSTGAAIAYTIILLLTGMADNILKPMMLGRGANVPMPVILFGALGGMATGGILGMFVGATALALGYEIFMKWVAMDAPSESTQSDVAKMKPHSAAAS
jgi:predicted PurR-regulated permease PerM